MHWSSRSFPRLVLVGPFCVEVYIVEAVRAMKSQHGRQTARGDSERIDDGHHAEKSEYSEEVRVPTLAHQ